MGLTDSKKNLGALEDLKEIKYSWNYTPFIVKEKTVLQNHFFTQK